MSKKRPDSLKLTPSKDTKWYSVIDQQVGAKDSNDGNNNVVTIGGSSESRAAHSRLKISPFRKQSKLKMETSFLAPSRLENFARNYQATCDIIATYNRYESKKDQISPLPTVNSDICDYLLANELRKAAPPRDKLRWAFKFFAIDGFLRIGDFVRIWTVIHSVMATKNEKAALSEKRVAKDARKVFRMLDTLGCGFIGLEQFLAAPKFDDNIAKLLLRSEILRP